MISGPSHGISFLMRLSLFIYFMEFDNRNVYKKTKALSVFCRDHLWRYLDAKSYSCGGLKWFASKWYFFPSVRPCILEIASSLLKVAVRIVPMSLVNWEAGLIEGLPFPSEGEACSVETAVVVSACSSRFFYLLLKTRSTGLWSLGNPTISTNKRGHILPHTSVENSNKSYLWVILLSEKLRL